jgi:hypothetical protein
MCHYPSPPKTTEAQDIAPLPPAPDQGKDKQTGKPALGVTFWHNGAT